MLSLTLGVGIIANFIFERTIFHMLEKESLLYYLYVYLNVLFLLYTYYRCLPYIKLDKLYKYRKKESFLCGSSWLWTK